MTEFRFSSTSRKVPGCSTVCIIYNVGVIREVTLTKTQGYVTLAEAEVAVEGDGENDHPQTTDYPKLHRSTDDAYLT